MNILHTRGVNISIVPQEPRPLVLLDVFDRENGRVVSVLYTLEEAQQVTEHLQREIARARAPIFTPLPTTGH